MPISRRLYPYSVSSSLNIRVAGAPHDPENDKLEFEFLVRDDESDEEIQTLDLTNSELPWKSLQIDVEVTIPQDELHKVLPSPSNPGRDTVLLLTTTCSETRLRSAFSLEYADGIWSGSVTLRRDQARGAIKLTPRLVRTTDIPTATEGVAYATSHGMIIAEGRSLNIRVDPPADLDRFIKIKWEDFPESQHTWLKSHGSDVFFLDLDGPNPVLFLNSHDPDLKGALHSKSKSGGAAVMRHLGNALIAQTIWVQLFQHVVVGLDSEEEENGELPESGWRKHVLKALLARGFPGLDESEQVRQLGDLSTDGRDDALQALIVSAAQAAAKTPQLVSKAAAAASALLEETAA